MLLQYLQNIILLASFIEVWKPKPKPLLSSGETPQELSCPPQLTIPYLPAGQFL